MTKVPCVTEGAGHYCAALARNAVDGELYAAVADGCLDLIEHAVFVHDHEIAATGFQVPDEFPAAHEIDGLQVPVPWRTFRHLSWPRSARPSRRA